MAYRIPAWRMSELQARVDTATRRAMKLSLSPMTLVILSAETVVNDETGIAREYALVEVSGTAPVLAGWQFCAAVDHLAEGNILRAVPGLSVPPEYREALANCDHCHTARNRRATYILRHAETGEYRQVGSSCLSDFLGGADPADYAALCEALGNVVLEAEAIESERDYLAGRGGRLLIGLSNFLSVVAAVIRLNGWRGRAKAREEGGIATADLTISVFTSHLASDRIAVTDEDKATATAAIAWAQAIPDDTAEDYLHNLRIVAHAPAVDYRHMGIAASMVIAHRTALARKAERESQPISAHFGEVGKRASFVLTVKSITALEPSYYGGRAVERNLVRLVDAAGNVAVWFTGCVDELCVGETYTIVATVKDHGEYRGVSQTVLTRAKKV